MPTSDGSVSHDAQTAQAQSLYRKGATAYDRRTGLARRYRERAVAKLALAPGQTVIDVACGTGLNFRDLLRGIGAEGQLVGVDLSPDMLGIAQERAEKFGWGNVALIESSIEKASLPTGAMPRCSRSRMMSSSPERRSRTWSVHSRPAGAWPRSELRTGRDGPLRSTPPRVGLTVAS